MIKCLSNNIDMLVMEAENTNTYRFKFYAKEKLIN